MHRMRNWLRYLIFTLIVSFAQIASAGPPFDVIIKGGTVYDGTGAEGRVTDIAIRGDRIAGIGDLANATAKTTIDARGLAVAPGFINMLSWSTESLIQDGRSQSEIRQGVTTEIMGEGNSMGPLNDRMKARYVREQKDIKLRYQMERRWRNTCAIWKSVVSPATSPLSSAPPRCVSTSSGWKTNNRPRSSSSRCANWCAKKWKRARSALAHR